MPHAAALGVVAYPLGLSGVERRLAQVDAGIEGCDELGELAFRDRRIRRTERVQRAHRPAARRTRWIRARARQMPSAPGGTSVPVLARAMVGSLHGRLRRVRTVLGWIHREGACLERSSVRGSNLGCECVGDNRVPRSTPRRRRPRSPRTMRHGTRVWGVRCQSAVPAPVTANARPATVFFSLMGAEEHRPTVRGAGPMTDAEASSLRRARPRP